MKKLLGLFLLILVCLFVGCSAMDKQSGAENNGLGSGDAPGAEGEDLLTKDEEILEGGLATPDGVFDAAMNGGAGDFSGVEIPGGENGEKYAEIKENAFVNTSENNKSFFTLDSNTASYANLRRYINNGIKLNSNIIKTDELINYFSYNFNTVGEDKTFGLSAQMIDCPWNDGSKLVTIGVSTKEEVVDNTKGNNLVFLIDVSGSMYNSNKLPLLKQAFPMMLDGLNDNDLVSIVTYASGVKVVLEACRVSEKDTILQAIDSLKAGGSTSGEKGIELAYQVASSCFIEGGNNRILLATDGDFNVGIRNTEDLAKFISDKRQTGIYLSILGVGMGNYRDDISETLAKNGNGNSFYIDSIEEAKKVLCEDLNSVLLTVAKDVKAQVIFNEKMVESYRLIGYENKIITEDDFNNEEKDAGEIGSGHQTVVVYEIKLKENMDENEIFNVTLNYKDPKTDKSYSEVYSYDKSQITDNVLDDYKFVACLVEFSLILRNSEYKGQADIYNVIERLEQLTSIKDDQYKQEFIELIKKVIENELI